MNKRNVYAIGETVLDIIFENNQPKTAKPGGSTLNSSVTLGRLNIPVSFISEWGKDQIGNLIDNFLNENNVSTSFVYRYSDAQTILAMAFLDENKNADYCFYKNFPKKRLNIELPELSTNDILLFSSFFALNLEVRPVLFNFIKKAKESKTILIYDPNFRKTHLKDLEKLKKIIVENMSMADIVRGSDEDFQNIFNANSSTDAYEKVKEAGCDNLIYTANKNGVFVHSHALKKYYPVPEINPISTIGAGDNFNAGVIYALYNEKILKSDINQIPENIWDNIIKTGIKFAAEVCLNWDNYISIDFANNYKY